MNVVHGLWSIITLFWITIRWHIALRYNMKQDLVCQVHKHRDAFKHLLLHWEDLFNSKHLFKKGFVKLSRTIECSYSLFFRSVLRDHLRDPDRHGINGWTIKSPSVGTLCVDKATYVRNTITHGCCSVYVSLHSYPWWIFPIYFCGYSKLFCSFRIFRSSHKRHIRPK